MIPSSMLIVPGWIGVVAGLALALALGGPAWCFLPTWLGVGLLALEACRHRPLRAADPSGTPVEVRYLADDPQEALLEGCPSSAGTTGVFAAVAPLVLLALGQLRRQRNRRHGHQRDFIDKLRKH